MDVETKSGILETEKPKHEKEGQVHETNTLFSDTVRSYVHTIKRPRLHLIVKLHRNLQNRRAVVYDP